MINQSILLKAISERQNGIMPNFSNIELNQAVDLVLFKSYSVDIVCKMTSDELDRALYYADYCNDEYYICPVCGGRVRIEYDGEDFEGYFGKCEKCNTNINISAYTIDDVMEEQNAKYDQLHDIIQNIIDRQKEYYKLLNK